MTRQLDDDRGGTIKWVVGKAIKRLEREREREGPRHTGGKKSLRRKKELLSAGLGGERGERRGEGIIERQSKDVRVRTSETLPDVPRIPKKNIVKLK